MNMNADGVGDRGRDEEGSRGQGGHVPLPKKKSGKIFFGQLSCKVQAFSGKYRVKIQDFFVNFSTKYHKNSGILIICRAREQVKLD